MDFEAVLVTMRDTALGPDDRVEAADSVVRQAAGRLDVSGHDPYEVSR